MKKTFLKAFTAVIAVLALSLNVFAAGSIVGSIDMPNASSDRGKGTLSAVDLSTYSEKLQRIINRLNNARRGTTVKDAFGDDLPDSINLYDKSNAVFGIEKVQFNANRAAAFSENLCVSDGTEDDSSLNLTSGAAGSFDLASGEVDYAQNIFNKMYPASITKVMTALVTLKNCSLDETVTVGEECQDIESGSSVCMIEPGDQLTVEQLLYGLLLNSGNDAAMSLAVYVGGTVDNFVNMMNEEAASLGATGTHFANPHGLHDENHYTTAYDIYLMFQEALKYDAFQKIIGSSEYYSIFIRDNDKYGIMWQSTNYYHIGEATPPQDVEVIGGKTGTTDEAGSCLCLLAKDKYGDSHVSIILNAGDKETLYAEMNKLLSKINN